MTLSEAIRLGAMNSPQVFGKCERRGSTCALGAALQAIGVSTENGWHPVFDLWPIARLDVTYPGQEYHPEGLIMLGSACWVLNDADRWTREQIADWVESIEQAQAQPNAAETVQA